MGVGVKLLQITNCVATREFWFLLLLSPCRISIYLGLRLGFWVRGFRVCGFRVYVRFWGFRVQSSELRFFGLGFGIEGLGFRIYCLRFRFRL